MPQYIDKTKIEEILRSLWKKDDGNNPEHRICYNKALQEVQCQLDTIEVEEMDLEKEIQDHIRECLDVKFPTTNIELIKKDVEYTARKFFELGLKAQIGE